MKRKNKLLLSAILTTTVLIIAVIFAIKYSANLLPKVDPVESFALIVMPDTQHYSQRYPDLFCEQTEWIADKIERLNIKFVSQLGDIVQNGGKSLNEWETASECMSRLDRVVPYGIVPGNHDSDSANKQISGYATYNTYFPVSRYDNYNWYKGNYRENQNSYQVIESHGTAYLFLNLEVEPSNDVLGWAEEVVRSSENEYEDLFVIVTTHKYLPDYGVKRDNVRQFGTAGNTGEAIWQKLVYPNCSIRMVLNGHYNQSGGENRIVTNNSCDEPVHQVVQDYQGREKGGNGLLRIYIFTPGEKMIKVYTYSTHIKKFERDEDSQFELSVDRSS